ncbi:MAG: hypothetical protein LC772_03675 [Chloroflexi bacterium]|nr:hypothetical protein [Chloroflexota bacterium]
MGSIAVRSRRLFRLAPLHSGPIAVQAFLVVLMCLIAIAVRHVSRESRGVVTFRSRRAVIVQAGQQERIRLALLKYLIARHRSRFHRLFFVSVQNGRLQGDPAPAEIRSLASPGIIVRPVSRVEMVSDGGIGDPRTGARGILFGAGTVLQGSVDSADIVGSVDVACGSGEGGVYHVIRSTGRWYVMNYARTYQK